MFFFTYDLLSLDPFFFISIFLRNVDPFKKKRYGFISIYVFAELYSNSNKNSKSLINKRIYIAIKLNRFSRHRNHQYYSREIFAESW